MTDEQLAMLDVCLCPFCLKQDWIVTDDIARCNGCGGGAHINRLATAPIYPRDTPDRTNLIFEWIAGMK